MKRSLAYASALLTLGLAATTWASSYTHYDVPAASLSNSAGSKFGYDPDSIRPNTLAGAPVGYGADSYYVNATTSAVTSDRYRTLRVDVGALFGGSLTLGELSSISYETLKSYITPTGSAAGQADWRLAIYTYPTASGDAASWYHDRLNAEPSHSASLSGPANTWNTWSTSVGTNQLEFYANRTGFTANPNLSWSDITNPAGVTHNGKFDNFSNQQIEFIDFIMGSADNSERGASQLDNITFTRSNGDVVNVNLGAAPVPLPAAGWAGLSLLGALGVTSKLRSLSRRRKA